MEITTDSALLKAKPAPPPRIGSVAQLSVRMGAGCWTVPGRMVASPLRRERGRVRNRSEQLARARAGVTTPHLNPLPLSNGRGGALQAGLVPMPVPTELGLILAQIL